MDNKNNFMHHTTREISELVSYIVSTVLPASSEFVVNTRETDQEVVVTVLHDPEDLERLLGVKGQTIRSIRTIFHAMSVKLDLNIQVVLESKIRDKLGK